MHYTYKNKLNWYVIVTLDENFIWHRGYDETVSGAPWSYKQILDWVPLYKRNPLRGLSIKKHGWKTLKGVEKHIERYKEIIGEHKIIQLKDNNKVQIIKLIHFCECRTCKEMHPNGYFSLEQTMDALIASGVKSYECPACKANAKRIRDIKKAEKIKFFRHQRVRRKLDNV